MTHIWTIWNYYRTSSTIFELVYSISFANIFFHFFSVLFSSHHYPLGGLTLSGCFVVLAYLTANANVPPYINVGWCCFCRLQIRCSVIGPIFWGYVSLSLKWFSWLGNSNLICRLRERSHISKTRVRPKLWIYFIPSENILGAESNSGPHGRNF